MNQDILFYNIRENKHFKIYGLYWLKENDSFIRLPQDQLDKIKIINEGVYHHAFDTAGGQVHFITDSSKLILKVKLLKQNNLTWMTDVGQGGFDCYLGSDYHDLQYISTTKFANNSTSYESIVFQNLSKEKRLVVLNLPLYNGVIEVSVGLEKDAKFYNLPKLNDEKILVYGTSIVQGGCVSRPGLAYSNILSRKLKREVYNFGFSGSAFGEEEIAKIISMIPNVKLFILDYEANAGPKQTYENSLEKFIQIIRNYHKEALILVCSQIEFALERFNSQEKEERIKRLLFQKELIKKLQENDSQILFLDCSTIFPTNYSEYTVDGIHPNDIGMEKLALSIYEKIKQYF